MKYIEEKDLEEGKFYHLDYYGYYAIMLCTKKHKFKGIGLILDKTSRKVDWCGEGGYGANSSAKAASEAEIILFKQEYRKKYPHSKKFSNTEIYQIY